VLSDPSGRLHAACAPTAPSRPPTPWASIALIHQVGAGGAGGARLNVLDRFWHFELEGARLRSTICASR